ncbi:AraC family transcriptional regulator [Flavivirga amylovorans]|uniref:AraC family transcriptional regulator n=1 Tax=Flavivirga amylovorans TaxID=870486 RepID=A0ABT8WY33_9FLAO|nr:AraC family transcriptional regulator [Flavivirga amylovorans]MDO5986563.1 AraC family transcriptional regulator [Flavivirga amylovorans]
MRKKDSFTGEKILVIPKKSIKILKKHTFTRGLYVTDVGFFPNAKYHYRERGQGCSEYILILCVKGSGWIEINGKRNFIHKNQYHIIPPNTTHKYASNHDKPWSIYWIHFGGENTDHFILPYNYPRILNNDINTKLEDQFHLFEEIYYTLEAGLSLNNLEYSSVILINLLGSLKYLSLYRKNRKIYRKDPISKATIYMKDNLNQNITVRDLAIHCGFSVSHFCLLFKKHTDHTPIEHLTFLRIQKACHLLDYSTLRINEIARTIGYEDPYYFTRVFKNTMGKSPSSYRLKKD